MKSIERDIITGLILSDAHLRKPGPNRRVHMGFTLKHKDFANSIQENLPSLSWGKSRTYSYHDKRTDKIYTQNLITTHISDYLTSIYDLWYENKKKMVPNIQITSTVLLWWYLGDGSLLKNKNRPKFRRISLATQSFTSVEVDRLIIALREFLNTTHVYPESGSIIISRKGIYSFAQKVGIISPAKCYQYKFDFGQYLDADYHVKSYETRPLTYINEFRKKHKVRELEYVNKDTILTKEK